VPGSPKQQSRSQQNAEKGGRCERDEDGKNAPERKSNLPECPGSLLPNLADHDFRNPSAGAANIRSNSVGDHGLDRKNGRVWQTQRVSKLV
jgi:hypothetical protein